MNYPVPYKKLFVKNGIAATMCGGIIIAKAIIDYVLYELKDFNVDPLVNMKNGIWSDHIKTLTQGDSDYEIVIMTKTKLYTIFGIGLLIENIVDKEYATGTGVAYARGAMSAGASAVTAVKIASEFDPSTGLKIESINRSQL